MEQLQYAARASLARWRLIGELVALIEQLPPGVNADAQNLWVQLWFQHKENAPTRDAVEDAVAILASRAVGVLRPINGSAEYQMTMQAQTAIRRLRALARALADEAVAEPPATTAPPQPSPVPRRQRSVLPAGEGRTLARVTDFDSARSGLLERLRALGFGPPELRSVRHVRLARGGKSLGLAFRTSKLYPDGKWWWAYTEAADRAPFADCDAAVLVGLMQDPSDPARARPEIVFVRWEDAVEAAKDSKAWTEDGRLHIWVKPSSARWSKWMIHPSTLTQAGLDAVMCGGS